MTQIDKFEDLNGRFVSLETEMTQRHKFRDWCANPHLITKPVCPISQYSGPKVERSTARENRRMGIGRGKSPP